MFNEVLQKLQTLKPSSAAPMIDSRQHWETIYRTKSPDSVSWYQPSLALSLSLIKECGIPPDAAIVDVGGGASTLAGDLLSAGFSDVTVIDISEKALQTSQQRLGGRAGDIKWVAADIRDAGLAAGSIDLWHDRAVFHFMIDGGDRQRYCAALSRALRPGGYVVIATFGPNGPMKCSGLETVRYGPEALGSALGGGFRLLKHEIEHHRTPSGATQEFLYCVFKKNPGS